MSIKAKYQYTHFIYPFVVDEKGYAKFINNILKRNSEWKFKICDVRDDEESYNFFLPYMRKFLFPTLFWNKEYSKNFKNSNITSKSNILSKISCCDFEYNLSRIKKGSITIDNKEKIQFDISNIRLVCFEPGICFLDIKAQIEEEKEFIDFDKILDFNHYFREFTPNHNNLNKTLLSSDDNKSTLKEIATLIKSVIHGFQIEELDSVYYDKMFTYSYVCVDDWDNEADFVDMRNDFYKFQYVVDSKSSCIFNKDCDKLIDDVYSRWEYSMFGFSRESGVVFVSDKEKYNITKMPYNFEKKYLYMLLLAFYQRISLINFSQIIMKNDKTMIKKMKKKLTKFTHLSWFSQITNSEHGMDIWKRWQQAFELPELFDEVHREYIEYYDFVVANGQERINTILIILYTVSVIFTGLQILTNTFDVSHMQIYIVIAIIVSALSYPIYVMLSWFKHKIESKIE